MSSANGLAGVQDVWPTYGYDTPPLSTPVSTPDVTPVSTPDVTSQLPHMSVPDVSGTVDHFAQSLVHVLHEMVEPAAIALGAMSGALLAGRAAMAATGILAHAAVRAAEEQRCLLRQQDISRNAAQQWESAAFAATRVNARRAVLAGRLARASRGTPPGSPPPPAPVLPPPVRPEGCRLDDHPESGGRGGTGHRRGSGRAGGVGVRDRRGRRRGPAGHRVAEGPRRAAADRAPPERRIRPGHRVR
ncbi:hypothetical protein ACRJ4W_29865 [Streptomyces sp. GLT-R25]